MDLPEGAISGGKSRPIELAKMSNKQGVIDLVSD